MEQLTWDEVYYRIETNQTSLLTKEAIGNLPFENTGNELKLPPFSDIFGLSNLIPLICFFAFFVILNAKVKERMWQHVDSFKQYRLTNLTICFVHSLVSGFCSLYFAIFFYDEMFHHTIHFYHPWTRYPLLFSISYFIYDGIDMLQHEASRFIYELMLHHVGTIFLFTVAVTSRKFVPFAYSALLMEVNSSILHVRTIMKISELSLKYPILFKGVQILNHITFIVFRFVLLTWQTYWVIQNHSFFCFFYQVCGYMACITFFIICCCLYARVLASDGLLGNLGGKYAAINRDDGA